MSNGAPIVLSDVYAARSRIAPYVLRTPLTHSPLLSEQAGCDLWLKQENRQHTGSFKPRGAINKILSLNAEELARGIVAASAGNHALGVAYACQALSIDHADIFVQANAAPAKIAKLRTYAIDLHLAGDSFEGAQQAARAYVRKNGGTYLSAYDDLDVITGQATCGLEIIEDLGNIDILIVPVGGGGLCAGIALAVKSIQPNTRIIGVNPAASPSALLSFQRNEAIDPYDHEPTLAQGLAGGFGKIPFQVARELIDEIVLVDDDELKQAMIAMIDSDQILAEASGIAAVAAALHGKIANLSGRVVAVISGGNIDSQTLQMILNE